MQQQAPELRLLGQVPAVRFLQQALAQEQQQPARLLHRLLPLFASQPPTTLSVAQLSARTFRPPLDQYPSHPRKSNV